MTNTKKADPVFRIIKKSSSQCEIKGYAKFMVLDTNNLSDDDIESINALRPDFLGNVAKTCDILRECGQDDVVIAINGHELVFHVSPDTIDDNAFRSLERMNVFCDYDNDIVSSYYF